MKKSKNATFKKGNKIDYDKLFMFSEGAIVSVILFVITSLLTMSINSSSMVFMLIILAIFLVWGVIYSLYSGSVLKTTEKKYLSILSIVMAILFILVLGWVFRAKERPLVSQPHSSVQKKISQKISDQHRQEIEAKRKKIIELMKKYQQKAAEQKKSSGTWQQK